MQYMNLGGSPPDFFLVNVSQLDSFFKIQNANFELVGHRFLPPDFLCSGHLLALLARWASQCFDAFAVTSVFSYQC